MARTKKPLLVLAYDPRDRYRVVSTESADFTTGEFLTKHDVNKICSKRGHRVTIEPYKPSNEQLARAFNDSGVFKPLFTCVPGRR